MANVPADLRYTKDHEYLKATGSAGVYYVGITDYAQGELGDIVFLDLPKPGAKFKAHDTFGTVEAVKAVSDLYCPVAGEVVEVNPSLESDPAVVNKDAYGDGWMIKLKVAAEKDVAALLDAAAYGALLGGK
ncbi:MAG TPA: glycine cleavage system protein GcvH [Gemmatimonadaceae bacterium]|nr:glycine cleavage system protein GcvH [Gemmatimonadaceae bacterium]